jgi:hypothetical protein
MVPLAIDHLWEREAYDETGRYLGRIEAVGMGRDRVPRRVGVRSGRARVLHFFMLTGARLDGEVGHCASGAVLAGPSGRSRLTASGDHAFMVRVGA